MNSMRRRGWSSSSSSSSWATCSSWSMSSRSRRGRSRSPNRSRSRQRCRNRSRRERRSRSRHRPGTSGAPSTTSKGSSRTSRASPRRSSRTSRTSSRISGAPRASRSWSTETVCPQLPASLAGSSSSRTSRPSPLRSLKTSRASSMASRTSPGRTSRASSRIPGALPRASRSWSRGAVRRRPPGSLASSSSGSRNRLYSDSRSDSRDPDSRPSSRTSFVRSVTRRSPREDEISGRFRRLRLPRTGDTDSERNHPRKRAGSRSSTLSGRSSLASRRSNRHDIDESREDDDDEDRCWKRQRSDAARSGHQEQELSQSERFRLACGVTGSRWPSKERSLSPSGRVNSNKESSSSSKARRRADDVDEGEGHHAVRFRCSYSVERAPPLPRSGRSSLSSRDDRTRTGLPSNGFIRGQCYRVTFGGARPNDLRCRLRGRRPPSEDPVDAAAFRQARQHLRTGVDAAKELIRQKMKEALDMAKKIRSRERPSLAAAEDKI